MKLYKFLLLVAVLALVTGCYSDDTNLDYKTLELPAIDNPENDPALFVANHLYKITLSEPLKITPSVSYRDMDDLSYKWVINSKEVATTKDLEWQWDVDATRVYGHFEIHRNSAGNSTIFSFSVELEQPYASGYSLLVERDGELHYDLVGFKVAPLYTFTYYPNAGGLPITYSGDNPRLQEYWSCEKAAIMSKQMFIDDDPVNCSSVNGESLLREMPLQEEFINETFPANFHVKDFMHGGFVSYLLADDGRIFQRKCSRIYYTGRFMDLPLQYNGKQIKGVKLVNTKYGKGFGVIYDETETGGRFLLVNLDYDTNDKATGKNAGLIVEFPKSSNMSGITDYELVDCWFIQDVNFMASQIPSIMGLFHKKSDGKYYTREVKINYTPSTTAVTTEEVYKEVYRELPDFGPSSKICVIRIDGSGYYKSGFIYYTSASDPRKLLVKERVSSNAPTEFHTFDHEVTAIAEGTMKNNNGYMLFALADGTVMMYATSNRNVGGLNFLTFEEKRIVNSYQVGGKVRWAGYKYGIYANFQ